MSVGAIAYARASEEELTGDAVALAEQFDTVAAVIGARGWRTHACALDRGIDSSASLDERPALWRALGDLVDGAAGALVVARLDRVSHSVRIWADLVERSYQQRWAIVVPNEGVELSVDGGEGAATLLGAAAREEQRWLSARTRAGIAAAQAGGTRLGRPVEHSVAARRLVEELHADGKSLQQIADDLTARGIPTPRGGRWHSGTIHKILHSADLDAQAAAKAETIAAAKGTEPAPAVAPSTADQAARAAEFDQRFPDSYNLCEPPTP